MVYLHASVAVNEVDGNFLRSLIDQNERLMPGPLFCLVFFLSTRRVRIKINWLLLSISLPCKRIFLRHSWTSLEFQTCRIMTSRISNIGKRGQTL